MQYTFTCPLKGCTEVMSVEASNPEEGLDKLVETAKAHLASSHPEIKKTDQQIRDDIWPNMGEA